jgi:hypothetical protein
LGRGGPWSILVPVALGKRGVGRLAAVVIAGGVLVSACAGSGYHYVKNSSDHAYFKVPNSWKLYDENAVINSQKGLSASDKQKQRNSGWQEGFDANPKPTMHHLGQPNASHPVGLALVEHLSFSDADALSQQALRNRYFDVDSAVQNNSGEIVSYSPVEQSGGFHGFHLVANLTSKGKTLTIDQTSLIDPSTSKVYTLIVMCESSCYSKQQSKIEQVVNSWTVTS